MGAMAVMPHLARMAERYRHFLHRGPRKQPLGGVWWSERVFRGVSLGSVSVDGRGRKQEVICFHQNYGNRNLIEIKGVLKNEIVN